MRVLIFGVFGKNEFSRWLFELHNAILFKFYFWVSVINCVTIKTYLNPTNKRNLRAGNWAISHSHLISNYKDNDELMIAAAKGGQNSLPDLQFQCVLVQFESALYA